MQGGALSEELKQQRSRVRGWLISYPRAVPIAIFLAISAITLISVYAIENNARSREKAGMSEFAQSVASSLDRRGNAYSAYLRAGSALLSTSSEIDRERFSQFVSELRVDAEYRSAEGIGWAESAVDPDTGERSARVAYLFPDTWRNRRAIGFDLYSDPVRRTAMEEARRLVRPTASGKVVLAQDEASDAPGFVMFMPVYGEGSQRPLLGYVYSPFNAEEFLRAAIEPASNTKMGVRLYDGEASSENLLASRAVEVASGVTVSQEVSIANRQLLLVVESSLPGVLAPLSTATLLFGVAVASLLMLLARLLTHQAMEDEARIEFFEEQNSIRNSLTRELNHRVKNTLANVLSILSLTRRRTDDLDEFADGLEGRIRALSATHDLLTQSEWGTTPIRAVIEAELAHFQEVRGHSVTLEGPQVELAPNDALTFGLAIHELATNAAKYGALSVDGGKISITWRLTDTHLTEVEWRELDGPPVPANVRRGFGTELIQKIVAHELKHPVELDFEPAGVRCVLKVPVRRRSDFRIREQSAAC